MLGKWLGLVLGLAATTLANESAIHVDCPELGREAAAEVEARTRATLLTSELSADVAIRCEAGTTTIRVSADQAEASRAVSASGAAWSDNVIAALMDVLGDLRERQTRTAPVASASAAPAPTATTGAAPPPAPPATVASTTMRPKLRSPKPKSIEHSPSDADAAPPPELLLGQSTTNALRVGLLGSVEVWDPAPAYGAALLLDRRAGSVCYGLSFGLASDFRQSQLSAYEGQIAAELGYRVSGVGLDVLGFAGASWLQVSPSPQLARSTTERTAVQPFVELRLALPLRFGHLEIVPGIGGRLFSGTRAVTVDGQRELALSSALARFTLGFVYEVAANR